MVPIGSEDMSEPCHHPWRTDLSLIIVGVSDSYIANVVDLSNHVSAENLSGENIDITCVPPNRGRAVVARVALSVKSVKFLRETKFWRAANTINSRVQSGKKILTLCIS
jgi:hypothetical protein